MLRPWSTAGVEARGLTCTLTALFPAASGDSLLKCLISAWPCMALRTSDEVPDWSNLLAERNSQSVIVQITHIHVWVQVGSSWEWDRYEKIFFSNLHLNFSFRDCNIRLLIHFFFYPLSCVIGRSAFWEFYSRGYVSLLISVWSRQRLLWPNGKLQMWDTHRSIWVHLWKGVLRQRSAVWMYRWVSSLCVSLSVMCAV